MRTHICLCIPVYLDVSIPNIFKVEFYIHKHTQVHFSVVYGSAHGKHICTYANELDLGSNPTAYRCQSMQQWQYATSPSLCWQWLYYCETGAHVYTCYDNPNRYRGMGSSVLLRRLSAVLTPTCRGSLHVFLLRSDMFTCLQYLIQ